MGDLTEVAITSDSNGSLWSCCAWDPQVGTNLCTYKGKLSSCRITANNQQQYFSFQVVEQQLLTVYHSSTMNS